MLPPIDPTDQRAWGLLQRMIDSIPDPIFAKDLQHRFVAANEAFCRMMGHPRDQIIGRSDPDFVPPEQVAVFWAMDDEVFAHGKGTENDEQFTRGDGEVREIWTRKYPLRDAEGAVVGVCVTFSDVTELRARVRRAERIEAENNEQRAVIAAQAALLAAMVLPVVEIWAGVLLIPLVGELSAARVSQLQSSMLEAITRSRARFVLLDLTGTPWIDSSVATALIRTADAAALLGCRSVLCGMGPAIASTVATLQIDFGRIIPAGTLRDGLALVMARLGTR